jgi:hypothetical protein
MKYICAGIGTTAMLSRLHSRLRGWIPRVAWKIPGHGKTIIGLAVFALRRTANATTRETREAGQTAADLMIRRGVVACGRPFWRRANALSSTVCP